MTLTDDHLQHTQPSTTGPARPESRALGLDRSRHGNEQPTRGDTASRPDADPEAHAASPQARARSGVPWMFAGVLVTAAAVWSAPPSA